MTKEIIRETAGEREAPKPCPFCSSADQVEVENTEHRDVFWVSCVGCGARGPLGAKAGIAFRLWNESREVQPVGEPEAFLIEWPNGDAELRFAEDMPRFWDSPRPTAKALYTAAQAVAPLNAAEAECDRLAKWLTAHPELWPCMSGSPVDVAIALLSKWVAPLNASGLDHVAQALATAHEQTRGLYPPLNAPSDSNANSNALQEHLSERPGSKFRKKPVVIEATQWFKHGDHPAVVPATYAQSTWAEREKQGWVKTLEGGHVVCPGDWIITGIRGEHYPCKPDIFEATYEPAAEAPPSDKPEKSDSKRGLDHAAGQHTSPDDCPTWHAWIYCCKCQAIQPTSEDQP